MLLGGAERRGKFDKNGVERAGLGVLDKLCVELMRDTLHQDFGRNVARFAALLGKSNGLVDQFVDFVEARKPVVLVADGREPQVTCFIFEVLYAASLAERQQVAVEPGRIDAAL